MLIRLSILCLLLKCTKLIQFHNVFSKVCFCCSFIYKVYTIYMYMLYIYNIVIYIVMIVVCMVWGCLVSLAATQSLASTVDRLDVIQNHANQINLLKLETIAWRHTIDSFAALLVSMSVSFLAVSNLTKHNNIKSRIQSRP